MLSTIYFNLPGGVKIPAIGMGTWQCNDAFKLEIAINAALEAGYRHIDTAFIYQNEEVIGKVLKEWFASGKLKREDIIITTKLPMNGVHEDRVEMFMKKSLAYLQLDYVDLYLIHFPIGIKYVEGQIRPPPEDIQIETSDHKAIWKKMEEQVDAGRAKNIGLSNFNVKQVERIMKFARIKPACLQVELHICLQQEELVNFCHQNEIVVIAFSPLGSPGYNEFSINLGRETKQLPNMFHNKVIKRIADKHKKTSAQVMLRYIVQRNIAAIPKSITPSRLQENIDVFNFSLDSEDLTALKGLDVGEETRICDFKYLRAFDHPEWPFPKSAIN